MSKQQTISKHIDKLVIRLFLAVFLISASVFAYRYTKYTPCKEVVFDVKAKEFRQGELIKFIDNTQNATTWEWQFDDSTSVSTSKEALHIFRKPGEYKVRLLVNDICEKIEVVTIQEKLFVLDSTKLPQFKIPNSIKVGETLKIKDETENASTWEWRFGETATINSKEKNAKYVYKSPGLKTVSLIVNGDIKHITKKQITVLPIEEVKKPIKTITGTNRQIGDGIKYKPKDHTDDVAEPIVDAPKVVPFISEAAFKNKLLLVSKNKINAKAFSEYFCGDLNRQLIVNGKNTTFLIFCEKIRNKRLKIKELTLYRDEGSNCIKNVTVKQNKILGIF